MGYQVVSTFFFLLGLQILLSAEGPGRIELSYGVNTTCVQPFACVARTVAQYNFLFRRRRAQKVLVSRYLTAKQPTNPLQCERVVGTAEPDHGKVFRF